MLLSSLPLASCRPLGLQATESTQLECPCVRVRLRSLLLANEMNRSHVCIHIRIHIRISSSANEQIK
jgi:hypothetical protein